MLYRYARVTDLVVEEGAGQELAAYQDARRCAGLEPGGGGLGRGLRPVVLRQRRGRWRPAEPVTQEELTVLLERLYTGGMAPAAADSLTSAPEGLTLEMRQLLPHRGRAGAEKRDGAVVPLWRELRPVPADQRRLV